jgi:hypothetical protein
VFHHDEVEAPNIRQADFGKHQNVACSLEMVQSNIGKDAVALQEPARAYRNISVTCVRSADAERILNQPALFVTRLINKRAPVICSIF